MSSRARSAIAIRHVHFEDLGSLEPLLISAGYQIRYADAGFEDIAAVDPIAPDLLVVLGGPIGAYESDSYPTMNDETRLLEARFSANRPTLGICLGAQLMAQALGARVYPTEVKEIGWAPVTIGPAGRESPLRHFGEDGTMVLHWHGDTFDLPKGASLLSSTSVCHNQAFSWGENALAFQFHPEVLGSRLERWFIGHACEISAAKLSVNTLRKDTARYAARLEIQARKCFGEWLKAIDDSPSPLR
jgi:GMP synthase (glutamine-hydrolysing)